MSETRLLLYSMFFKGFKTSGDPEAEQRYITSTVEEPRGSTSLGKNWPRINWSSERWSIITTPPLSHPATLYAASPETLQPRSWFPTHAAVSSCQRSTWSATSALLRQPPSPPIPSTLSHHHHHHLMQRPHELTRRRRPCGRRWNWDGVSNLSSYEYDFDKKIVMAYFVEINNFCIYLKC